MELALHDLHGSVRDAPGPTQRVHDLRRRPLYPEDGVHVDRAVQDLLSGIMLRAMGVPLDLRLEGADGYHELDTLADGMHLVELPATSMVPCSQRTAEHCRF